MRYVIKKRVKSEYDEILLDYFARELIKPCIIIVRKGSSWGLVNDDETEIFHALKDGIYYDNRTLDR